MKILIISLASTLYLGFTKINDIMATMLLNNQYVSYSSSVEIFWLIKIDIVVKLAIGNIVLCAALMFYKVTIKKILRIILSVQVITSLLTSVCIGILDSNQTFTQINLFIDILSVYILQPISLQSYLFILFKSNRKKQTIIQEKYLISVFSIVQILIVVIAFFQKFYQNELTMMMIPLELCFFIVLMISLCLVNRANDVQLKNFNLKEIGWKKPEGIAQIVKNTYSMLRQYKNMGILIIYCGTIVMFNFSSFKNEEEQRVNFSYLTGQIIFILVLLLIPRYDYKKITILNLISNFIILPLCLVRENIIFSIFHSFLVGFFEQSLFTYSILYFCQYYGKSLKSFCAYTIFFITGQHLYEAIRMMNVLPQNIQDIKQIIFTSSLCILSYCSIRKIIHKAYIRQHEINSNISLKQQSNILQSSVIASQTETSDKKSVTVQREMQITQ